MVEYYLYWSVWDRWDVPLLGEPIAILLVGTTEKFEDVWCITLLGKVCAAYFTDKNTVYVLKFKNSCVLFYTVWVQPGPHKKWCRESLLGQPPGCVYASVSDSFRAQQWNFIFHTWSEEEVVSSILKYKWMHFQFTTNSVFLKLTRDDKI